MKLPRQWITLAIALMLLLLPACNHAAPITENDAAFAVADEDGNVLLDLNDVRSMEPSWHALNDEERATPVVFVELTAEGTEKMKTATEEHLGETLHICHYDRVLMSPRVEEVIDDGALLIGGDAAFQTYEDAVEFVKIATEA